MSTGRDLLSAIAPWLRLLVAYALSLTFSALILVHLLFKALFDRSRPLFTTKKRPLPPPALDQIGKHAYVQLKNVKLHYVEAGQRDKPLMLFLHGFPEFWYSWRHQIKEFSEDYWTVAVDMRGYGESEKPSGIKYYKVKYLVEDVKNLIDALGKENCVLIAHDWGALVAWKFLESYPKYVSTYVAMSAPPPKVYFKHLMNSFTQFRMSWYIFFFQMPYLPELFLLQNDMYIFDAVYKYSKMKKTTNEEDLEASKFTFGKPGGFTCPINYYRANIISSDVIKRHKDVGNGQKYPPGLFLFAEKEKYIDKGVVYKTRKIIPNLKTEIVSGVGHFLHQDDPNYVNQAIRQFLKGAFEDEPNIVSADT